MDEQSVTIGSERAREETDVEPLEISTDERRMNNQKRSTFEISMHSGKKAVKVSYDSWWSKERCLVDVKRDPYWTPPPPDKWQLGDNPAQDPICAKQLKLLRDEMMAYLQSYMTQQQPASTLMPSLNLSYDVVWFKERNSAGHVYLRFDNTESARNAQQALHGRWFAGKMITATYMLPLNYEAEFPDGGR